MQQSRIGWAKKFACNINEHVIYMQMELLYIYIVHQFNFKSEKGDIDVDQWLSINKMFT